MSMPDPLDQLKKLAELRDRGVVSSEEFEAKKAQLLASVGQPPPQEATQPAPVLPAAEPPPAAATTENNNVATTPLERLSDAELVGRVRPADITRAEQQWRALEESSREAARSRTRLRWRRVVARLGLRYNLFVQTVRVMFDKGLMGRSGARAVLLAAVVGLFLLVTIFCTLNPAILLAAGLLGGLLGHLWVRNLLFHPSDADIVAAEGKLRHTIADFAEPMQRTKEESDALAARRREARTTLQRFQAALRSHQRRLLATDWRALRGIGFSNFLAEVFGDLGFSVEATKVPGDQPVDLILARGEMRIAVQTEAQEGNVGNGPVRQTHLAKIACRCERCCVITNSAFTPAAKQLAANLGCQLIDGSQIPDLIRGKTAV